MSKIFLIGDTHIGLGYPNKTEKWLKVHREYFSDFLIPTLEKNVKKGDIIATKDSLSPSFMTDAYFTYLKTNSKPLKNRTKIRFHTGTSETMGNIILLDRETA